MSEYFNSLLKATGNEYGSKVSDGIEAGDVSDYIDSGSYILNALISGIFMGEYLQIKLQHSLEKLQLERPFLYWALSNSFLQIILAVVFFILSLNLLSLSK